MEINEIVAKYNAMMKYKVEKNRMRHNGMAEYNERLKLFEMLHRISRQNYLNNMKQKGLLSFFL